MKPFYVAIRSALWRTAWLVLHWPETVSKGGETCRPRYLLYLGYIQGMSVAQFEYIQVTFPVLLVVFRSYPG